jgi:putative NADH-flavin reductase
MKIVVLGATGATGRLVITRALSSRHAVTAVVRSTGHDPFPAGVNVVRADVTDPTSLAAAVEGSDAVIGTLGATKGPLIEQSTAALLAAAGAGGPHRMVVLSGYSVLTDRLTRPARLLATTAMKAMSVDKLAGEELMRASDADWTIVHATRLTNGPATGKVRELDADYRIGLRNSISRPDVAEFLVRAVSDPALTRRALAIAT